MNLDYCKFSLAIISIALFPFTAIAEIKSESSIEADIKTDRRGLIQKLIQSKQSQLTEQENTVISTSAVDLDLNEPINKSPEYLSNLSLTQSEEVIIADSDRNSDPDKWSGGRPDGHAPIGVMGEHTHKKGEFMFSYRYMLMKMDGNRDGTKSISDREVLQQYMVTPVDMTMQMHMVGAMYGVSDDVTLMAMVPYVSKEMEHLTRMGGRFTTNSEGFGDIKTTALYTIFNQDQQRIHLNLGASFPTGSINERDDTPVGKDQILPYPMQIGSGTFDLLPGITYLGQSEKGSWGAQALTTLRLGKNDNGYRLGNQYQVSGWIARNWTDWLSTSLRLTGATWGNIDGADSRLNPMMIPTADPNRRGGTQLNLGFGVNLYAPEGNLKGSRLAMEFELPIYRSLDGPQLETDWQLTLGLQSSF
ncbi:transporter [Rivularia sp. UHCC 0363]|uniref:transporter n=1 Tax=Rivularia sp. UHCC 0363 TaxID=3110244 RepID=UPI002B20848D|nr:transporter [Rivularia sp. UHCC 0363]MEA5597889.1 transporter [Rivularia sp. UHCC 0363]